MSTQASGESFYVKFIIAENMKIEIIILMQPDVE